MSNAVKAVERSRSLFWLQGLLCGLAAAFATPTAVLGSVLLAPGLTMLLVEHTPSRPLCRTMLLFGLAASLDPARSLWAGGHTLPLALSLVSDIAVVGFAWAAAAAGWLVSELAPVLVRLGLEAAARAQSMRLRAERTKLEAEWETLVTDRPAPGK
jgi:hypothetical protein